VRGRKGGSAVAAATVNALLLMARQEEGAPLNWCRAEAEQAARNPSADAVAGEQR